MYDICITFIQMFCNLNTYAYDFDYNYIICIINTMYNEMYVYALCIQKYVIMYI